MGSLEFPSMIRFLYHVLHVGVFSFLIDSGSVCLFVYFSGLVLTFYTSPELLALFSALKTGPTHQPPLPSLTAIWVWGWECVHGVPPTSPRFPDVGSSSPFFSKTSKARLRSCYKVQSIQFKGLPLHKDYILLLVFKMSWGKSCIIFT